MITEERMLEIFRAKLDGRGKAKAFATKHNISQGYVSDILNGKRPMSSLVAEKLGYQLAFFRCNKSRSVK